MNRADTQDLAPALAEHVRVIADNLGAANIQLNVGRSLGHGLVLADEIARFADGDSIIASQDITFHENQGDALVRQAMVHYALAEAAKIPF